MYSICTVIFVGNPGVQDDNQSPDVSSPHMKTPDFNRTLSLSPQSSPVCLHDGICYLDFLPDELIEKIVSAITPEISLYGEPIEHNCFSVTELVKLESIYRRFKNSKVNVSHVHTYNDIYSIYVR